MLLSIGIPFVLLLLLSVAFYTLSDRKFMAAVQRRLGPNVVGFKGLLQPLTDGGKLFGKQIILIKNSNSVLFQLAPILAFAISIFNWTLLPFFSTSVFGNIISVQQITFIGNKNLLFIFFVLSLATLTFLSAGWSSFSKYAVLGGIRGANQALGYELIISFVIIIIITISRAFSVEGLMFFQVFSQVKFVMHFDLFLIFWISILAETGRVPFDLPESESELVAGYFTEYSGFLFALFFLAEYSNMMFSSTLITLIFFNGWLVVPFSEFPYLSTNYLKFSTIFFIFLIMFSLHRAVLARIRIDQLYYLNWKIFLPLLSASFFLSLMSLRFYELNHLFNFLWTILSFILVFLYVFWPVIISDVMNFLDWWCGYRHADRHLYPWHGGKGMTIYEMDPITRKSKWFNDDGTQIVLKNGNYAGEDHLPEDYFIKHKYRF